MKTRYRRIMGKNCILEVLKTSPERIVEVYTSQTSKSDPLYSKLLKHNISVKEISKKELSNLVQSDSHQSYVAAVKEKEEFGLRQFFASVQEKDSSVVLMLDSIYDPQNLGAIIRAGECFGADLILFSRNRGGDITPVASKASVGATELVPIIKVSNLADTMKTFQKEGFWAVTADVGEHTQPLYKFQFPQKTLLVLGSEGKGVQPLLCKKCDFHVSIPMLGQIDSLNVSQATAVFLSHYQRGEFHGS